ncbi:MAG: AAA family ATPase [Acidiferrobacterales bacterium]
MPDSHDLELNIKSRVPIIVIESQEEARVVELCKRIVARLGKPLYKWTVTEGLQRLEAGFNPQKHNAKPAELLAQIKATTKPGVYLLFDFHPYLEDPIHVRYLKEIAQNYNKLGHTLLLISHSLETPPELRKFCARFVLRLPNSEALKKLIVAEANAWSRANPGEKVKTDPQTLDLLVRNLLGLTEGDAKRLIRGAIYDDGAITGHDLSKIRKAKHDLLSQDGIVSFEYDTAKFSEVGGLATLKDWFEKRKVAFNERGRLAGLDMPKGILLVGVQGCGKSLAAKAVAGVWGVPLLRLDLATLYNKFIGETERNLREALKTAEVMAPCVLWIDEIEKGLSTGDYDGGTSHRVMGTFLTWMAENKTPVFIVATANNIDALPAELVRKGRLDEIFFVDLPSRKTRKQIFTIHFEKRHLDPKHFDIKRLVEATEGFSGAEIEQAIVSTLYTAHADNTAPDTDLMLTEIGLTRPLSVVMAEKIGALRAWAADRTVPAD